jgi:hypothetical protein
MILSESGLAELDCIFQTDFPQDGPKDKWVVSPYEKPVAVEFLRVNAVRAIRYKIPLHQTTEGKTEAEWRQIFTGLHEPGDHFVERLPYSQLNYLKASPFFPLVWQNGYGRGVAMV